MKMCCDSKRGSNGFPLFFWHHFLVRYISWFSSRRLSPLSIGSKIATHDKSVALRCGIMTLLPLFENNPKQRKNYKWEWLGLVLPPISESRESSKCEKHNWRPFQLFFLIFTKPNVLKKLCVIWSKIALPSYVEKGTKKNGNANNTLNYILGLKVKPCVEPISNYGRTANISIIWYKP